MPPWSVIHQTYDVIKWMCLTDPAWIEEKRFKHGTFSINSLKQESRRITFRSRPLSAASFVRLSYNLFRWTLTVQQVEEENCNCRKSRCLKLWEFSPFWYTYYIWRRLPVQTMYPSLCRYCQCFAAKSMCTGSCRCVSCANNENHTITRNEAIESMLLRNPAAFDSKYDQVWWLIMNHQCVNNYWSFLRPPEQPSRECCFCRSQNGLQVSQVYHGLV